MMAKDYKSSPVWEPVPSEYGAKAALLASKSAMSAPKTEKPTTSEPGHSAANIAFRIDRSVPHDTHAHSLERQKSLLAAKGAMANRRRAESSPIPKESYPDEANAAANALSAATRAHKPVRSPTVSETSERFGSVPFTNMNRQMYTSRPPVKSEVEEQKRADVLHASALAMAKKMYTQQQKMIDAKKAHDSATLSHDQLDAISSVSDDGQPAQLTTLQDAAYKQAQARLARMHEEHFKNREYQEYYGAKQPNRRFSIRGKLRKRASSDGDVIEDRRRSQKIRQQMSLFSNKLSEMDDKKRQHDQETLLAAAQRNVHERLREIDEKISAETGMVPPSTMTQWETKAHAAAQIRSDQRVDTRHGRVDLGAGKLMDQEEIDAIAAARVKPVLDEINGKIEEEHARQTELRLEMEKRKEAEEIEKARLKEIQDISKKLKEQDKQEQKEKKAEEKHEAKLRREEDRANKAEQKRLAKADKRKSTTEHSKDNQEGLESAREMVVLNDAGQPVSVPAPAFERVTTEDVGDALGHRQPSSPDGESSRTGVKTWFKNRFSRVGKPADEEKGKEKMSGRGFIGGAALTGVDSPAGADNRSASVRSVALAGREQQGSLPSGFEPTYREAGVNTAPSLSTLSDDEYPYTDARDSHDTAVTPPRQLMASVSLTPSRDSRFREMV